MAAININNFAKKAYPYFINQGMTPAGACGMMGNIYSESAGFIANRVEFLCLRRLKENGKNYSDETYTAAVNSGKISKAEFFNPLPNRVYGFGSVQWTSPSRKSGLYDRTVAVGKSIADEDAQLEYIIWELKNKYQSVWKTLTTATSVKTASDVVLRDFESPDNWQSLSTTRADYGQQYYNYFKSQNSNTDNTSGTMTKTESAIQWMEKTANDKSHGYDQTYRWNEKGDYDCSSAVITAWQQAGVPVKTNGATYTGNMYSVFTKLGFKDVTSSVNLSTGAGLQRGDVLLNHQRHVAMYCGNGQEVEASINEKGTATGGQPGDQTGKEFLIRPYRHYPWNAILRYTDSSPTPSSNPNELKLGDTGQAVKTMQQMLIALGYNLGDAGADGEFGQMTDAAVRKFQTKHKLTVDGVYGPQTKAKLEKAYHKKFPKINQQYQVRCGIFEKKSNAEKLVKKLVKSGFEAIMYEKNGKYYVQSGIFNEQPRADALCSRIKAAGFDCVVVVI